MSVSESRTEPRALSAALLVIGLLLIAANLRTAITSVGPVLPSMERELGLSGAAASMLISLPVLAFAVVSPLAPGWAKRFGLERTMAASLAALAVGLVVRSAPPNLFIWVGTALIGVAIAVLNVLLPSLVKRDFPTKIGQMTGIYSAVQASFAAIAAGIAVPIAGATALGWRLPLGMWAGLALVALVVLGPQLRRQGAVAVVAPSRAEASAPAHGSPWANALAWQISSYMGLQSVVFYVFITWLPSIEAEAGISESTAGWHLLVLNAAGILGTLLSSALIPRLRDQRALGVTVPLGMLAGTLGVLLLPQLTLLWVLLAGTAMGASIVLALSFFGLRTVHHTHAAALSGMAQSFGYLLAACGPLAAGALHDLTGSWTPALVGMLVVQVMLIGFGYQAGRNRTVWAASSQPAGER